MPNQLNATPYLLTFPTTTPPLQVRPGEIISYPTVLSGLTPTGNSPTAPPADLLTRVTVVGRFVTDGGARQTSPVTFRPVRFDTAGDALYAGAPVLAYPDANGNISVPLAATDDPQTATPGFQWLVVEPSGAVYLIAVPAGTVGPLDLGTCPHLAVGTTTGGGGGQVAAAVVTVTPTAVKAVDYNAVNGDLARMDATAAPRNVYLPAATAGRIVGASKVDATTNLVTFVANGSDTPPGITLKVKEETRTLIAIGGAWVVQSGNTTLGSLDGRYDPAGAASSAVAALVGTAPAILDTLQEIDAQLGSDESAAAALATTVAAKLSRSANLSDVASPATARTNLGLAAVAATGAYTDLIGAPPVVIAVPVPTGVAATDTAAVQGALNVAHTAGGGYVQLQFGVYVIAAPGTPSAGGVVAYDNTVLAGRGIGQTILQVAAGTSTDVTGVFRTPSGVQNTAVTFRDFTVDGNKTNLSGSPVVIGFFAGVTPQSTSTDTDIACERVEIRNCSGYGFDPHERVTRLRLTDCLSHHNGTDGFTLDGQYDAVVEGCIAWSNTRHGFNFVTASARAQVTGCKAYGNGSTGFTLQQGAKACQFGNCAALGNTGTGWSINGIAQTTPQLDTVPGGGHTFTGCTSQGNGLHGLQLAATSGNTLSGCHCQDNSQTATGVSDHFLLDETSGIGSTLNTLTGCTWGQTAGVSAAAKYGIEERSTLDGPNFVVGCSGAGTTVADLHLVNTTSIAAAAHNGIGGGHPATFAYGADSPAKHGVLEWNYDPVAISTASQVATAGTLYLMKITPQASGTITNIIVNVGTAGSGLTAGQNFAALSDSSGNRIGLTADQSTAWASSGVKIMALSAAVPVVAGVDYWVELLANGTTPPSLSRAGSSIPPLNVGLPTTGLRFAVNGTALTSIPTSITPSTNTGANAQAFWTALS